MRLSTLIAAAAITLAYTFAQAAPDKVEVDFTKVYVPQGFDSNDHIQIVGEGEFSNACYRPYETKVQVDANAKKIILGPAAYKYNGLCLQVVLEFNRVIDIGILPEGKYEIVSQKTQAKLGELDVKKAKTDEPDDFLYAPVAQSFVRGENKEAEIVLQGYFPSNCMSLEEVKTTVANSTIVVQPIAKMEERKDCLRGRFPFTKVVKAANIPKDRYLLHVRTINANAVNTLVDLE